MGAGFRGQARVSCAFAVALAWFTALAAPRRALAAAAVVAAETSQVHASPDASAPVIQTIGRATAVTVSDRTRDGWRLVLAPAPTGYVLDRDLTVARAVEPASPAEAAEVPPRLTSPYVVRAGMELASVLSVFSATDASSVGLTFGRNLLETLALEATVGVGLASGSSSAPGVTAMALARGALPFARTRRHAVTLAAGPFFMAGGSYGAGLFAHAEIAYEYRLPSLFTLLVGLGPDVTLIDSQHSDPRCNTFGPPDCVRGFSAGSVFPHVRLGVGHTF